MDPECLLASHSLVPQLLLCHHHVQNVPKVFTLSLLSVFGDVADADAGDLPQVLGRELKRVSGAAASGSKKKKTEERKNL